MQRGGNLRGEGMREEEEDEEEEEEGEGLVRN